MVQPLKTMQRIKDPGKYQKPVRGNSEFNNPVQACQSQVVSVSGLFAKKLSFRV
jgi:hypothetical protein